MCLWPSWGISHLLVKLGYALILEEQLLPGRVANLVQGAKLGLQVTDLVMLRRYLVDQRLHALGHLGKGKRVQWKTGFRTSNHITEFIKQIYITISMRIWRKPRFLALGLAFEIASTPPLAYLLALALRPRLIRLHAQQLVDSQGLQRNLKVPAGAVIATLHKLDNRAEVLPQLSVLFQGLLLLSLHRVEVRDYLAVGLLLQVRHVAQDGAVYVQQEVHPLLESD